VKGPVVPGKENEMGGKSSKPRMHVGDSNTGERNEGNRNGGEVEVFKGLCMNCANRFDCLLPKSEGGVWHCEEYVEES